MFSRVSAAVSAAAAAALITAPGVASASRAPVLRDAHQIRQEMSGLCLTARGRHPGAPVVMARCGRPGTRSQEWVIGHGVVKIAGTRLYLTARRTSGIAVLGSSPGADGHWRWLGWAHVLKDVRPSQTVGYRVALAWRQGRYTGRRPYLQDPFTAAHQRQERWSLIR